MSSNLATALLHSGVIDEQQALTADQYSQRHHCSMAESLVALRIFTSTQLLACLADLFKMNTADIHQYEYPLLCQSLNVKEQVLAHCALPMMQAQQVLTLAIADPTDPTVEQTFGFFCGKEVELILVDCLQLTNAIRNLYGTKTPNAYTHGPAISHNQLAELITPSLEEESQEQTPEQDDAPVSRFINQVILDAVHKGASDIHFEPYEHSYRIRLRCDGLLVEVENPAAWLAQRLAARLKILANLDIAERRLPQDGRIKVSLTPDTAVDIRVSTLPTQWGEKIVLRLLDNRQSVLPLDELGYSEAQKQEYLNALKRPQGMIIVTGPTGSGKTVSLYTGLSLLNRSEVNISSAEDPVEVNLAGINQVQVNHAIGFGFAEAIRAFLRQDPDVIMLGEIRDTDTAQVAIRAAQTGHLVLSTLHTNSAAESVVRLLNMGVARFNITSALSLVIAQRLVRRLCPHCKKAATLSPSQASAIGLALTQPATIYCAHTAGCSACVNGYTGRLGVFEVMPVNAAITTAIESSDSVNNIELAARKSGVTSLRDDACKKLLAGLISLAELERVLYY